MTAALEVRGLRIGFGDVAAVRGVDLRLTRGEVVGLVGESGSGKSATALGVMGLLPPSATVTGSVRLGGTELLGLADRELARIRGKDLAMVFQDPQSAFTPVYSIGAQIAETVRIHQGLRRSAVRARVVELLDLVGIPDPALAARAFPHEFSGGMRQRAMIAMAMANKPSVLIADEPTTALDVTVQAQVLAVLREARAATGAALLLVTHDLGVVAGLADRVLVMNEGRIVEDGTAEEIFERPRTPYTVRLLQATPRIDTAAPRPRRPVTAGRGRVLQVEGLVRHYRGGARAVDGVDFDVHEGETLALVGESGCGKTTTLLEIMALHRPQRGRISVFGRDTAALGRSQRRALRRDLQIVFQDPVAALDPRMPVGELIAEPLWAHGAARGDAAMRVRELAGLVGLGDDLLGRYPQALSGGQRQRVGIARALALRPRLVVLDEPVSALDVAVQAEVLELLADLRRRLELAYLVVAHDLAVVRMLADRVAVMYLGRIVELGTAEQIYRLPRHPYTKALLAAVPVPDPRIERARVRTPLAGDPPSPAAPPPGCRFHPRCPAYRLLDEARRLHCTAVDPRPRDLPDGRLVACHHTEQLDAVEQMARNG